MVVRVELIGVIRDLVKDRSFDLCFVDRKSISYGDVLEELVKHYGPRFRDRLYGPGGLLSIVKVYSEGNLIKNLDQILPPGDEADVRVIVFAAAGGG